MISRKFTFRENVLLLVMMVILVVFAYYKLVAEPVSQAILSAQTRQMDAEDLIVLEEVRAIKLQRMEDSLGQLAANPDIKRVPEYDNMKFVVSFLNSTLKDVQKYNLSFTPISAEGELASRTIDMSFVCSDYNTAKSIIEQLYNAPYRNEIEQVQLQKVENETDTSEISFNVRVSITFFEYVDGADALSQDTK